MCFIFLFSIWIKTDLHNIFSEQYSNTFTKFPLKNSEVLVKWENAILVNLQQAFFNNCIYHLLKCLTYKSLINSFKVTGHSFWSFAENHYCMLNISPILIKFSPNVHQCMQNVVKL
jgi:hypothetical protein